jgi:hypothetical protein
MPDPSTVMKWLQDYPLFSVQYTRAREEGMDRLAELAIDEAASGLPSEMVPGARLAFDARRWYVGKIAPKRYGDRLETKSQVELGGIGGGPVQVQAAIDILLAPVNLAKLDDGEVEQLNATLRPLLMKLAAPAAAGGPGVVEGEFTEVDPAQEAGGG